MKSLKAVFSFLLIALMTLGTARAGQVTGTFATPGGSFIQNATITFTLSQLAVKTDASQTVAPSTVSCYTSVDGSLVGLPNPQASPVLAATSGSMTAGTYYEVITYWNASGETLASPEQTVVLSSSQGIQTSSPGLQPAGASGYKIYVGIAPGGEVLQATVTGFATTSIGSLIGGSSPPISNSTPCNIAFNDTFIPAYTTYRVSALDSTGSPLPGFPQSFYLQGSTVNLNTMLPASGLSARFPQPIVASPINTTTQSINSNLSLNGHSLSVGPFLSSINNGIQVVGNGTNTNFTTTAGAMGATGAAIVPPGYAGTDNAFVNSNGPVILDFRPNAQGSLGLWHGIHAMHPVNSGATGFPGGNDIPMDVWGPGDILPANNPVACTASTSVTPGTATITVGTCADTTGKGGPSGTTASLSHNTSVTIIVDPGVAGSEEVITNANWSIASATTITATFAKSHTAPYTIWQRGATQVVTDFFSITGVLGLSFVDLESNGTNLINMAGQVGIRPAGDISAPVTQLDVHSSSISSALTCPISAGDNAADRMRICYSSASPAGTKNTFGFLSWGSDVVSGDLDIAARGNQPTRIFFWTSPDAGTTGLSNFVSINQLGQVVSTKATGAPPFVVASTTNIPNLNASVLTSSGTGATLTGTGACATITTQTGGAIAGSAKCTGTTGASTLTITPGLTAPNGWHCRVDDETTRANLFQQTSHTATACTLTVTSVTQNDVFVFSAIDF